MGPQDTSAPDGVTALVPREKMTVAARKLRDTYARVPGAPFYHKTFGLWMCLDTWREQDLPDGNLSELFHFDGPGNHSLGQLGWCTAAFAPGFEERQIEDRGETEVVQDVAGRHVLFFKGRRTGFMPEYVDHPVKDLATWEENVRWRLDPTTASRYADLAPRMERARQAAAQGQMICQNLIGGYMYLRSLLGPEQLLYAFYDMPAVVHACMEQWLLLADTVIAQHQESVTLDVVFLAEDICYNCGPLISPDMFREFLVPYYQQLLRSIRSRQLDPSRHLYVEIDTDGYAVPMIRPYQEAVGMEMMNPFEVASGCDVVAIGAAHPELALSGGIDKRVLAGSLEDIDRMCERILPVMRERGGYIPTCDHGVPPEVPWRNYLHYRQRCAEFGD
jgi:uroporphyrinogen decarboxylase